MGAATPGWRRLYVKLSYIAAIDVPADVYVNPEDAARDPDLLADLGNTFQIVELDDWEVITNQRHIDVCDEVGPTFKMTLGRL